MATTKKTETTATSPARRWLGTVVPAVVLVALVVGALVAKRQAPWIPWLYLAALIVAAATPWVLLRWRIGPHHWRVGGATASALVLVALLPVPWMTVKEPDPPGTAWRLDGRVLVDGATIDPAGQWYWLTVGRPPLVAEVVGSWVTRSDGPIDLRHGLDDSRPTNSEPIAVAAGLHAAGDHRLAHELDVTVGGWIAGTPVGNWYRSLAVGRSHGLMVALVTYSHASGEDLAASRTIAGTGAIEPDGTVTRVGGLLSKARAAEATGADVMIFPAEQAHELAGFDPGDMELIAATNLTDAIDQLRPN